MFHSGEFGRVLTAEKVAQEMQRRRTKGSEIRKKLDAFAMEHRGVDGFTSVLDEWMPPRQELQIMLARQLAGISIECIAADLLGEWMSEQIPSVTEIVGFRMDTWAGNGYKKSLTTIPSIQRRKGNRLLTRGHKVVPGNYKLNRLPILNSIPISKKPGMFGFDFTGSLRQFHLHLRHRVHGCSRGESFDVSSLWNQCLRASTRPPDTVFYSKNGFAYRSQWESGNGNTYTRPPAEWYYPLYLSMFLDGTRALMASTIEEDDDRIRDFFLENIELIREKTGEEPLIIWTPHYSDHIMDETGKPLDFNQCNLELFDSNWRRSITLPERSVSCYHAVESLLHQIATYGHPDEG